MDSTKLEYLELVQQTELHLMQEYSSQSWLSVSRESYLDYRAYAVAHHYTIKKQEKPLPHPQIAKAKTGEPPVIRNQNLPEKLNSPLETSAIVTPTKIPKKEIPPLPTESTVKQPASTDFSDFRKIFAEKFPEQILKDQPPSDALAKEVKAAKKESQESSFFHNLCQAVKIIYDIKVEISNNQLVWIADKEHRIPLMPLNTYLKDFKQKIHLWQHIVQSMEQKLKQ